jgi:hypothetical protein
MRTIIIALVIGLLSACGSSVTDPHRKSGLAGAWTSTDPGALHDFTITLRDTLSAVGGEWTAYAATCSTVRDSWCERGGIIDSVRVNGSRVRIWFGQLNSPYWAGEIDGIKSGSKITGHVWAQTWIQRKRDTTAITLDKD